jgi:hypothetical protein
MIEELVVRNNRIEPREKWVDTAGPHSIDARVTADELPTTFDHRTALARLGADSLTPKVP